LLNELRQRTADLTQSLEDLRGAQDRLVQTEKLASLGQLTAGIAHEIKNPLNFVNNFSAVSIELIDELREALGGVHLDTKLRADIRYGCHMIPKDAQVEILQRFPSGFQFLRLVKVNVTSPSQPDSTVGYTFEISR
jgi:signal transduction histidine kinase